MEQADASPDVARLSDEEETRLSLALASTGSATERAGRAYLRLRGHEGGCLAIVGWEGDEDDVERRRLHTRRAAARAAAACAGRAAGRGVAARPLRRALPARRAARPRRDGGDARDRRPPGRNLPDALRGASATRCARRSPSAARRRSSCATSRTSTARARRSTSPSWPARSRSAELEQWRAAKAAACDAIVANGGTITHHHAIGRDHAPWMPAEVGELGRRGAPRREGAARPGRDHEPGQAAALAASARRPAATRTTAPAARAPAPAAGWPGRCRPRPSGLTRPSPRRAARAASRTSAGSAAYV